MKILTFLALFLFFTSTWSQTNVSKIKVKNLNLEEIILETVLDIERYTLISVGGTWCKPCLLQKPFVASLGKQYPQYLKVIYLYYRDTPEKIKAKFGDSNELENYFLADYDAIEKLSVISYPTNILIDSEGNIVDNDVSINDVGKLIK